ncbi:MAG: glucose-6-phosphate dehydrogenase [Actinomycetota bacterium]
MKLASPEPQIVVIFGASGDLTHRKIIPALYNLLRQDMLPERFAIVGYARTEWTDDQFRDEARKSIEEFSRTPLEDKYWKPFSEMLSYRFGAFDDEKAFHPLHDHLAQLDKDRGTESRRLYYAATPPSAFPVIIDRIGECPRSEQRRIVIEKPFGRDLDSARALTQKVHEVFDEREVFRIDHYLGKETVQNLLVFRFANSLYERVWNRDAVDHVQVTVAEEVGVEQRGAYYEEAGVIRDMVQNHLLQLVSFLAMEPPQSLEPESVRDEKVKLLRGMRPFSPDETIRGQYGAGSVEGHQVPSYHDEADVARDSETATYIALRAHIDNWRWAGVPFYLRTGKALARHATELTIMFKEVPTALYDTLEMQCPPPDHLVIRVQPEEGISFTFQAKEPGPGFKPRTVNMHFTYADAFGVQPVEAYERLIHDAMLGDHTLFTRADEVERAWQLVAPLLEPAGPPLPYPAGSHGPEEADGLIAPSRWHLLK